MRQKLWFACVACALAVLPGLVVGAVASLIVGFFNMLQFSPDTDFLYLKTLFGIEAPGVLINWVLFRLFPIAVQGGIAGAFAVWLTAKVYLGERLDFAAYMTGALYTGIVIALTIVLLVVRPWIEATLGAADEVSRLVGLWIGIALSVESQMVARPLKPPVAARP